MNETVEQKPSRPHHEGVSRVSLPRWGAVILSLLVWLVGFPLFHGVLPWELTRLGPWYGWSDGRPEAWNVLGLIPIAAAAVCLVWVAILHFAQTPQRVEVGWTPAYLLTRGPYAFTRNPIYLSETAIWIGWS